MGGSGEGCAPACPDPHPDLDPDKDPDPPGLESVPHLDRVRLAGPSVLGQPSACLELGGEQEGGDELRAAAAAAAAAAAPRGCRVGEEQPAAASAAAMATMGASPPLLAACLCNTCTHTPGRQAARSDQESSMGCLSLSGP